MRDLAGRTWYLGALVLGLTAIACQIIAHYQTSCGIMAIARAMVSKDMELERIGFAYIRQSQSLGRIGLACAALAACSWLFSRRRREPGNPGVLVGLPIIYVFLLLLLV
jgi:hypothetical protein